MELSSIYRRILRRYPLRRFRKDPAVPKAEKKQHPLPKVNPNVLNLPLYYDEGELGEVFGYMISFKMEPNYQRRIQLPVYENSICTTFPDKKFTGFRGYLYEEADLPQSE